MKEGVNRMLCDAVRCVGVDETVFDVLMILLYVEATRKRVCRSLEGGRRGKG